MIKPETAIEILAKNGIKMNREVARKVLELRYFFLVKIVVDQIVENENSKKNSSSSNSCLNPRFL